MQGVKHFIPDSSPLIHQVELGEVHHHPTTPSILIPPTSLTPPPENRDSIDSELAAMPPHERVAYLSEFEHSDKHDAPKKGGLIEKLIARGNKRTEEQLAREAKEREERDASHKQATHAVLGPGAGASAHSAAGPTTDATLR